MAKLLDVLEDIGSASAIFNEYEITVRPSTWENDEGAVFSGWVLTAKDFLAETGQRTGPAVVVKDYRLYSWDELAGILAELGVPDRYEGWS